MDYSNLNFLSNIIAENIVVEHYDGAVSIDTGWSDIVSKSVPERHIHVIVAIAADNTVSGELDILIEDKSILPETMQIESFPANMEYRPIYIVVGERLKWSVKARGAAAATLKYNIMVYKIKRGVFR